LRAACSRFRGAAQFGEIELAGVATVEAFAPGAPEPLESFGFLLVGTLEQPQRFAHHLAGRGVAAGVDFALDEADELGRQGDRDVQCGFFADIRI
jgi:hypothetical protein